MAQQELENQALIFPTPPTAEGGYRWTLRHVTEIERVGKEFAKVHEENAQEDVLLMQAGSIV